MAIKLNRREKHAIVAGAGIVCIFVFVQFILFPCMDRRERLKRTLQVKTKMLEDMRVLKSEYDAVRKAADLSKVHLSKRKEGFTLFSFLDNLAGQTGIKDHIAYMKPSISDQKNSPYKISSVEMKIQGVSLEQLTSYLYLVETSENMAKIKRISISKTGEQQKFIDAVLQVETFVI